MVAMYFVGAGSLMALVFAAFMFVRVRREPGGNPEMLRISGAVQKGANAYLRRQYKGVGIFFAAVFVILLVMAFCGFLSFFTPFAFLTGGFFSGLSGFIGMRTATMANCRTAQGASRNLNKGLRVAFSAGSVMGFTVVGLGLLDLTVWYFILNMAFGALPDSQRIAQITANMLTFGMGASSMALFARVGGGIFTKAADVGADLVGKVEAGIPEDDPRNPAVIADNVGDNVGDVAGMGADLYESYVGSIVSTAALAVAAGYGGKGVAVPMMLAALGVLASILGTFFVKTEEDASQKNLLKALRTGTYISAALVVVAAYAAIRILLPDHMGIYAAILSGLAAGVLIGAVTEYYTSDTYNPTRKLAASSRTGGATVIISGLSLGMLSTVAPVVIVGVSVLISYYCSGGSADFNAGLYGVGVSAVGMLSTLGITLATDAYGPVADNAGGIAEMTHMPEEVRQRTDALDSLGNTTAATGKGFAIGSAALTALALIASYIDKVKQIDPSLSMDLSITNPTVLIGLFIGGMLPFLFAALTMEAVGEAAQSIVVEVRRK
jgi:K(+)-stimulated pyrophosphate-energized sodium pump